MSKLAALGLDFVDRRPRSSPGGWLLLLLGALVIGIAVTDWLDANDEIANWTAKAAHWDNLTKRTKRGSGEMADGEAAAQRPQVEAAAKAIGRLATPWGALYRGLEEAADDTVSLLAILPNAEKGEVRLNGEAKDFAALRGYMKRLGESGPLTDLRLLGQEIKQTDPQRPIVFAIGATWRKTP